MTTLNRWPVNSQAQALNITYMEASSQFIATSMGEPGAQTFANDLFLELLDVEQLPKVIFSLNSIDGKVIQSLSVNYNSGVLKITPVQGCQPGDNNYLPNEDGVVVLQVEIVEMPKEGDSFDFSMVCVTKDGGTVNFDPKVIIGKPEL